MTNTYLKETILEVVDNQLKLNEPKCTSQTFERLKCEGFSKNKAKEMIAAVLLEEIYDVMKFRERFDEQRYAEKLKKLGK